MSKNDIIKRLKNFYHKTSKNLNPKEKNKNYFLWPPDLSEEALIIWDMKEKNITDNEHSRTVLSSMALRELVNIFGKQTNKQTTYKIQ